VDIDIDAKIAHAIDQYEKQLATDKQVTESALRGFA